MKKVTDALLNDHKMIRKLLSAFIPDNPRYGIVSETLERVVLAHAWFEDQIFFPAVKKNPLLIKKYMEELSQEHQDLEELMRIVIKMPSKDQKIQEAYSKQFSSILDTHLKKEEDALFPLAEKILSDEGQITLREEMEARQMEVMKYVNKKVGFTG